VELPTVRADLLDAPAWEQHIDRALGVLEAAAATGDLSREWQGVLEALPRVWDLLEDRGVPRAAADLSLGTRVLLNGAAWTIVSGEFGTLQALVEAAPVHLARESARGLVRRTVDGAAEVMLWEPSSSEVAAQEIRYHRAQSVLFAQATATRSHRARCDSTSELLAFERDRFDLWAIQAGCRAAQGAWASVHEAVDRAEALDSGEPSASVGDRTPEAYRALRLSLLDARARASLVDAFRHGTSDREALAASSRAHAELRAYVVDVAHEPSALRAVGDGIHRLAEASFRREQEVHARRAVLFGVLIVVLLPLGHALDAWRVRRARPDFRVDGGHLPSDPFPLVRPSGDGTTITVPPNVGAGLIRGEEELRLGELLASGRAVASEDGRELVLREGERFVADFGETTFLIHHVPAAKVPTGTRAASFDGVFLGVIAALLFVCGVLGAHLFSGEYETTRETVEQPSRIVELHLQPEEKPLEAPAPKPLKERADPGDKPKGPAGRSGRPEAKLAKAKGARVAARNLARDRSIAERAGLIPELDQVLDRMMDFGGGDLDRASANLGSHVGTQYGVRRGSRGHSDGGGAPGGGGGAERLGGVGVRGLPGGVDLERPGEWRRSKTSGVGPSREAPPIVIGGLHKSVIDRVVKQHLAQFRFCYERELQKDPELHGKVVMKWVIGKDGRVSTVGVKRSSMDNTRVDQCMESRVRRLRFPAPRGGGIVSVSYPFVFSAR
jgi:hypothetical protein